MKPYEFSSVLSSVQCWKISSVVLTIH